MYNPGKRCANFGDDGCLSGKFLEYILENFEETVGRNYDFIVK